MPLSPDLRARIQQTLASNRVVLFMKGDPQSPRCGFSAKAVGILNELVPGFGHVDVLADGEIREGIKEYGQWPTIPQLYVDGELVGGSDIIEQMHNSGELHEVLGVPAPDRTPPTLEITPTAAEAIARAMAGQDDGVGLHLQVDPKFNARFQLGPITGQEIVAEVGGIRVHLDLASAPRASGIRIDWVEDVRGSGLAIHNPNAPPLVQTLTVTELSERMKTGSAPRVIDVRPPQAREQVPFPPAHEVLDEDSHDRLAALPKDTPLAFLCHHGNSSRQAAEHFRALGFRDLHNINGGIDAWAQEIDASVARY